jgi:oligopeptide/dipeptide ABC transporter ATP-binding protein
VREIFNRPAHPYTMALLDAVPKVDARVDRLHAIPGTPSSGYVEQPGCPFAPRCTLAIQQCHVAKPPLTTVKPGHTAECWRAQEVYADGPGLKARADAWAKVEA